MRWQKQSDPMDEPVSISNENLAEAAFSLQAPVFDTLYVANPIIQYKRDRVRAHVDKYLRPGSHILELNAGTGEDAVYFAKKGYKIHATDISASMQKELQHKVKAAGFEQIISTEICSFNSLQALENKGPYDLIFSNFAGLNCTGALDTVLNSFDALLKEHGMITLVIMPPFSTWELVLVFKGQFKTAFRRFGSKKGRQAHIEGQYFTCWYYKPSYIIKTLKKNYEVLETEGLCTIVPPSYLEHFADKRPALFSFLKKWEERLKNSWPWKNSGDYFIISLRKKSTLSS
jgi:ubiquinone/menaquinone biosynthesis C-methylase UbiE